MPEISVIIPCYKVEKYLPECLASLLNQTFADFEAICVNDGSPDNCADILVEYAKKDKRIRILTQQNQGLSMARNNGLKQARGNFIYFLDSDDTIHPQCLEIAHTLAIRHQAEMVSFDFIKNPAAPFRQKQYNTEEIEIVVSERPFFLGTTREKDKINYNVWTKLYRKSLLAGIEFIPHISFEDYPHTFAVLAKNPKTVVAHVPLYFYTVNPDSISHKSGTPQHLQDYRTGIDFVYRLYNKPEKQQEMDLLRQTFIPNILKHQLGRCRRANAKTLMYRTFAGELRDLRAKGLLTRRGHKFTRWLMYNYLMWRYK